MFTAVMLCSTLCASEPLFLAADVRQRVESIFEQKKALGMVVGIITTNGAKHFWGFGKATEDATEPPDENTLFEIGSVTKTFTALLLAEMVEKGEVALDDPAQKYLPAEWPIPAAEGRAITLVDLATHTAGFPRDASAILRHALFDDQWGQQPFASLRDEHIIESLKKVHPREPFLGKVHYSNFGYGLLGEALARRANLSYADLVRERITDPLHMTSTAQNPSEEMRLCAASGHDEKGKATAGWRFAHLAGCGALWSTAADMLIYLEAQMGRTQTPLSSAMKQTHEKRFPMTEIANASMGLAWIQRDIKPRVTIYWHNGGTGGFSSSALFCTQPAVAVVVLSNTLPDVDQGACDELAYRIVERLVEPVTDLP